MRMTTFWRAASALMTTLSISIAWAGVTTAMVMVTPSEPLDFGTAAAGSALTKTVTFTAPAGNTSPAYLILGNVSSSTAGTWVALSSSTCGTANPITLAAGSSCTVDVRVTQSAPGAAQYVPTFQCSRNNPAVTGLQVVCNDTLVTGARWFASFVSATVPAVTPAGLTALLLMMLGVGTWAGLRSKNR